MAVKKTEATPKEKKINTKSLKDIPHLGPVSEAKFNALGVYTMRSLYTQYSATNLHLIAGMTLDDATEAILFVGDALEESGEIGKRRQTAFELYQEQQKEDVVSTGCKAFDGILGGGIKAGYVTEIYGENKSGKTQTCIAVCIEALLKDENSMVLYIDAENKLKIDRFVQILLARGIIQKPEESSKYLDRMIIWTPTNSDEQIMYIQNASSLLDSDSKVSLMVIDSIISLFQSEYMERGVMKTKFNVIKPMMLNLMKLALTYKIPIFVVNTVYKSPTPDFGADDVIPAGGNSVGHPLAYRIKVREVGSGKKHRALMVKSPEHAESEADFKITDKGIEDV